MYIVCSNFLKWAADLSHSKKKTTFWTSKATLSSTSIPWSRMRPNNLAPWPLWPRNAPVVDAHHCGRSWSNAARSSNRSRWKLEKCVCFFYISPWSHLKTPAKAHWGFKLASLQFFGAKSTICNLHYMILLYCGSPRRSEESLVACSVRGKNSLMALWGHDVLEKKETYWTLQAQRHNV